MFVVVLTVSKGSGRLLTSPDIISRGFIYLRDSEELMGIIRQYLKQKVARSFGGRHVDLDVLKKEIKDEITHVLYDQTRRTPIVIPVINEIGGGGPKPQHDGPRHQQAGTGDRRPYQGPEPKTFPAPVVPDIDTVEPRSTVENRAY
jgi:ribonuclease J